MQTIEVKFSCNGCGLKEQPCLVGAREDPDKVGVVSYVESVRVAVEMHHRFLSPNCPSNVVDLMIPFNKDDKEAWVGQPMKPE